MTNTTKKAIETAEAATATATAMITAQAEQALVMAKANFEQMAVKTREAMEKSLVMLDSATEMTRGNVDALLESSRIATGNVQAVAQEAAEYSKQSLQRAATAAQNLLQVKTAPELMKLQSDYTLNEFTLAIAEMSKLSHMMFENMTAALEPLQKRASNVFENLEITKK
jgi:hypothetical protein